MAIIRPSVGALCRDGTSEISHDPRTKRLETWREWLAIQSHQKSPTGPYLPIHMPKSFIRPCNSRHENPLILDFTIFVSSYSSSSSYSLLEPVDALNFSLNVSRDAGDVHRLCFLAAYRQDGFLAGTTANRKIHHFHAVFETPHPLVVGRCATARPCGPRRTLRLAAGFFARLGFPLLCS